MPTDLKIDIAHVVRTFRFTGMDAGTFLARAQLVTRSYTLAASQRG
jgi:hypothetical protein